MLLQTQMVLCCGERMGDTSMMRKRRTEVHTTWYGYAKRVLAIREVGSELQGLHATEENRRVVFSDFAQVRIEKWKTCLQQCARSAA